MDRTLQTIKSQIEVVRGILAELREEFDHMDASHPYAQVIKAQDITIAAAKLDALEHLYKICGGV